MSKDKRCGIVVLGRRFVMCGYVGRNVEEGL